MTRKSRARMGQFTGVRAAQGSGFGMMIADPETFRRQARVPYRSFFDAGDLQLIDAANGGLMLRILGFPLPSASLCQIRLGVLEASVPGPDGRPPRVEETACTSRGHACCELLID